MQLYVTTEAVLTELNLALSDATVLQKAKVDRRIAQAQAKILLYLGRASFEPETLVVREQFYDTDFPPTSPNAWPWLPTFNDRATYISHSPTVGADDLFDVTFHIGLDLANDPELEPIKTAIVVDAAESLMGDSAFPTAPSRVTSVSAGGQSVSFEKRQTEMGAAGGHLAIAGLGRFRRFSVGHATGGPRAPWPYGGRA